ncbi:MAG: hypothetical protein QOJ76_1198 [Acidobacteriota bacterium]|jgi:hypothetical protein|nr:hypothetical protein [Acidobacteriota bacterium]
MHTRRQPHPFGLHLALSLFLLLTAFAGARAQSPCRIGFLSGTAPTVDGNNAVVGAGHEWDDASILNSGDACLGGLLDQDNLNYAVRVLSKRYTRAGQPFLGFYVEVQDASSTGVALSNGGIPSGERFVVMFDPNHSRGASLGNTAGNFDYRVMVSHAWQLAGTQITDAQATVSDSSITQCGHQSWAADAPAAGLTVSAQTMLGGYKFELEIPLPVIGIPGAFPASEIGVAFSIHNDFGQCLTGTSGAACPNTGYVAFPSTINITTNDNPVTGCHASWRVPDDWATSSSTTPPPGQVTILRTPAFWNSQSLNAFQCGSSSAGYTYYPVHPCKVELKAQLKNTTGSNQTRNLLFLWAKHGTGDPLDYNVVSLVENVVVPAGASVGPFASGVWAGMPLNEPNHPCVRVYILPNVFRPDFDRAQLLAITTRAEVLDMVAKYGLIDDNWAQKNLTRHNTATDCPDTMCFAAQNNAPDDWRPVTGTEVASLSSPSAIDFAHGGPSAAAPYRGSLFATDATTPAPGFASRAAQTGGNSTTGGQDPTGTQNRPPLLPNPGTHILMAPEEFRAFSRDNVIVQVRSFETEEPTDPTYYRYAKNTGGVIHLFPVKMLDQLGAIPFELNVSASAIPVGATVGPRIVTLSVDMYAPPGIATNVQLAIDTSAQPIGRDETRVVRGVLFIKGRDKPPGVGGGSFKRWGLSLHAGASIPHGNFANIFNPGPNVGVDLEYRFSPVFSLEGIYTFHHFRGERVGEFRFPNLNLHQLSVNGKIYGSTSPVRPFFNFGGGVYVFDSGTTRGGANIGGGLQFDVTPTFAVDAMYNFNNVFTSGSNLRFSTAQGGVRFRF